MTDVTYYDDSGVCSCWEPDLVTEYNEDNGKSYLYCMTCDNICDDNWRSVRLTLEMLTEKVIEMEMQVKILLNESLETGMELAKAQNENARLTVVNPSPPIDDDVVLDDMPVDVGRVVRGMDVNDERPVGIDEARYPSNESGGDDA